MSTTEIAVRLLAELGAAAERDVRDAAEARRSVSSERCILRDAPGRNGYTGCSPRLRARGGRRPRGLGCAHGRAETAALARQLSPAARVRHHVEDWYESWTLAAA